LNDLTEKTRLKHWKEVRKASKEVSKRIDNSVGFKREEKFKRRKDK
jgi:hypothetical protein